MTPFSQRALALLLFTLAFLGCQSQAAPVETKLAGQGQASLPVVVSAQASPRVREAAATLARYLARIGDFTFAVQTGDGATGIVVGRGVELVGVAAARDYVSDDPTQREDYLLRSHAGGVWLIGATDLAVEDAVWDFLHRLGYRQYFPGPNWEVVPRRTSLSIAVDAREHPDYQARRIWYGFGTWPENEADYRAWNARNRVNNGIELNTGHAYDGIIHSNQQAFRDHPEYHGLVNGERKSSKFCISNPGLRQLVVDHALRHFTANPIADSISVDPSDGGGWCECEECAKLGSISDRAVLLANTVAAAVNEKFPNKYVGMYAYNQHSPPPNIRVHPNVIISVATSFIKGGYTVDQLIEGWQKQGATIGIREYYSVITWDRNMPAAARGANFKYLTTTIPRFHKAGARFLSAESSENWGPNGLGYYIAGRTLWDTDEAGKVDALVDDFLDKCFGPARAPMAQYYALLRPNPNTPLTDDFIGRMYRHLEAARKLTNDPAINARLNDLVLYTRYVELYHAYAEARGEARQAAFEALIRHNYRIRRTMMVHSKGLYRDLPNRDKAMKVPADAGWNVPEPKNPWKSSAPFTAVELSAFVADGIQRFPLVEIQAKNFPKDLVSAAPLKLPEVAPGNLAVMLRGSQTFYTWSDGKTPLRLRVTAGNIYNNLGSARLRLVTVEEAAADETGGNNVEVAPDKAEHVVELKAPPPGLSALVISDHSAGTVVDWDPNVPMTAESSMQARPVFNGRWTAYCYVPKGTRQVAGFANGAGTLQDSSGKVVQTFDGKPGYFDIAVAPGQDGKLWKFVQCTGPRLMMTIPPYLARSGSELLLPREVVEADTPR